MGLDRDAQVPLAALGFEGDLHRGGVLRRRRTGPVMWRSRVRTGSAPSPPRAPERPEIEAGRRPPGSQLAATLANVSRCVNGTSRSRTPAATAGMEVRASAWRTNRPASTTRHGWSVRGHLRRTGPRGVPAPRCPAQRPAGAPAPGPARLPRHARTPTPRPDPTRSTRHSRGCRGQGWWRRRGPAMPHSPHPPMLRTRVRHYAPKASESTPKPCLTCINTRADPTTAPHTQGTCGQPDRLARLATTVVAEGVGEPARGVAGILPHGNRRDAHHSFVRVRSTQTGGPPGRASALWSI